MPSTAEITRQVTSGQGVYLNSVRTFIADEASPSYQLYRRDAEPVLALLEDLRTLGTEFFGREPTYEELAQNARLVDDALSGEYESAAVLPLAKKLVAKDYAGGDYERLIELASLAHQYVADMVCQMLTRTPERLDHIAAIVEACKQLESVHLATLNHDLVIEQGLESSGVRYSDGFERRESDVRFWTDEWEDGDARLLKLHGSLDWWAFQVPDEPWRGWTAARYRGDDVFHAVRDGRSLGFPQDSRPIVLTGTFDKILAYETWIFPDQHLRFHEALRRANRLVVIGYSFGDKAINSRIIAWLGRSPTNTLVVCHREPDLLQDGARGAIRSKWQLWKQRDQLRILPIWVADLTFTELQGALT